MIKHFNQLRLSVIDFYIFPSYALLSTLSRHRHGLTILLASNHFYSEYYIIISIFQGNLFSLGTGNQFYQHRFRANFDTFPRSQKRQILFSVR